MAGFNAKAIELALDALIATGTPKLAFMATDFTHDKESQSYWADISADIASGTTLRELANVATTIDTTNNRVEIDFDDVTETPVTTATDQVCMIIDTGNVATSPIVACADISTTLSPVGGTLTLVVNAEGLAAINY